MTAVKTVDYAFPVLASLADNTLTALTQITVYLPEGSKTFKSVIATVSCDDIITATGGTIASTQVQISVNGAGATNVTNSGAITHSSENLSLFYTADFTAHFTANFGAAATSRTVDCSVLVDQSTGTTLGMVNVCVTLSITYEYDETSATHVKTVRIPLNAPVGALATSKPGSPIDTIPALDTYCPEASKTFRQINIVVQGNEHRAGATTDSTISIEIDSAGAQTTGNHEGALASDRWIRYVFQGQSWDTSATRSFYIWGSVARYNHLQAWLEVTYEFDPASSTRILNSLWLPAAFGIRMGSSNTNYMSASIDLWVEEPGSISDGKIAAYLFWTQAAAIGAANGLNMRIGTGGFVAYTDTAAQNCGGNGAMIRNDAALTLARGRNTLTADIYRSDITDTGYGLGGVWLVCYTSDVPADGVHVANQSVRIAATAKGTSTGSLLGVHESSGPFATGLYYNQGAWQVAGVFARASSATPYALVSTAHSVGADRALRSHRGGACIVEGDAENGMYVLVMPPLPMARWSDDPRHPRLDPASADARVSLWWRGDGALCVWHDLWITYHGITFEVAGNVTGSDGGTVDLTLHRASDGEQLASTSRVGDGAYSMTWYDDTEDVYVSAHEDATHVGRSAPDTAA